MGQVSFVKMSAAGNDFIIIDSRKNNYQFNQNQISKISKRNNIGCDQFIILKNSNQANIFMDIYNSDGSGSAACGNATRCVAFLVMQETNLDEILVETKAGILPCKKESDSIVVNMGKPQFEWDKIPLSHKMKTDLITINALDFAAVNVGNPHIVTFVNAELSDEDFFKLGPKLENHDFFPQKTNVEFAKIISPEEIKVRVWERGVGETLACGSGACAVGVVALKKGLTHCKEAKISFKGGDIFISLNTEGEVLMRGGATKIFYGVIDENFLN